MKASFGGTPSEYGRRIVAYLIDVLLGLVPLLAVVLGVVLVFFRESRSIGVVVLLLGIVSLALFPAVNFVRQVTTGASFGKKRQGIRLVLDVSGQPIGLLYGLLRVGIFWGLNAISGGLFFLVDALFPAFDPKKQRVVDKILGTVVVVDESMAEARPLAPPTQPLPPPSLR